jgi:hypothetical protein
MMTSKKEDDANYEEPDLLNLLQTYAKNSN